MTDIDSMTKNNVNIIDSGSLRCLLTDLGIHIYDNVKANDKNITELKKVLKYNIDDVIEGKCDLVVPRMIAIINNVSRCLDGSWMMKLIDPFSKSWIVAYVAKEIETVHEGLLVEGNAILLENCSIFVNKRPFSRMINIVQRNLIAIYSSKHESRSLVEKENDNTNDNNNDNKYENDNIKCVDINNSDEQLLNNKNEVIPKKKKSID
jgi:hypothetical protein